MTRDTEPTSTDKTRLAPLLSRRGALTAGAVAGVVVTNPAAAAAAGAKQPVPGESAVDIVLYNGEILTMSGEEPRASAIAISGDRILAVGDREETMRFAGRGTKVVNLRGQTVVPGLIDGHTHAIRGGQTFNAETYWLDERSLASALGKVAQAAAGRQSSEWVAVVGSWHPNQFVERRPPTLDELNAVSATVPIYIQYLYGYALVNEAGIEALGLNSPDMQPVPGLVVERGQDGRATGRLTGGIGPFNTLVARILPATLAQRVHSLEHYFQALNQSGVTGFIDDSAGPAAAYDPLFALEDAGRLTLRAGYRVPAQAPGGESAFFEKLMEFRAPRQPDGLTPFVGLGEVLSFGVNDGTRQAPGFKASADGLTQLRASASMAAVQRVPIEVHAYTDDAASQILDVLEDVNGQTPISDLRWTMAHLNTGRPETFQRLANLGMAFSVQMGPYYEAPEIAESNGIDVAMRSAARAALDRGLVVAGGTDATRIGDYRVWPAIEYHVTGASAGNEFVRPASQRLTRTEALRAYTYGSAWLAFAEDDRGTLEAGKLADLAVLDRNYLDVPSEEIGDIRSVLTMVGGRAVFDPGNWLS